MFEFLWEPSLEPNRIIIWVVLLPHFKQVQILLVDIYNF
jgi:hypothetical protein